MLFAQAMDEMESRVKELQQREDLDAIRPDLNGSQIMEILDIEAGPEVGRAYKHMLEYRLDNGPVDEAQARTELLRWWSEQ
jgi:poly(A) polymerase